jgi:hypothetical protein
MFDRMAEERFTGIRRGRLDRVFDGEKYSGSYGSWVGRVGELILARVFFHPSPVQTVIIDDYIVAKNLPKEAWQNCADVILYDVGTNFIEGLMEVKVTSRPNRAFRIAQRVGGYSWFRAANYAVANGIPIWLGLLRLKRLFPYSETKSRGKEVVGPSPKRFIEEADLAEYISEALVYGNSEFEMDEHTIRLKPGAKPALQLDDASVGHMLKDGKT